MKNMMKWFLIISLSFGLMTLALGFASSYLGWYGYKKWQYRVGTGDIKKSKERGVFVKELHFKIDSFATKIDDFHAYIEMGFRYGHQSEDQTVLLTNSKYPYQLTYSYKRDTGIGLLIRKDQLSKFDSSNYTQGFLAFPDLKDTIIVQILGRNNDSAVIRIWQ